MNEADRLLCALCDLDDREVDAFNAAALHGMRISGVTRRKDRRRKKQYVELKLFVSLPLPESEAA